MEKLRRFLVLPIILSCLSFFAHTQASTLEFKEGVSALCQNPHLPASYKATIAALQKYVSRLEYRQDSHPEVSCERAFQALSRVRTLSLPATDYCVESLEPIGRLINLEALALKGQKNLSDLRALRGTSLKSLNLQGTEVADLHFLTDLRGVTELGLTLAHGQELSFLVDGLEGAQLSHLNSLAVEVASTLDRVDLSPLRALHNLSALEVTHANCTTNCRAFPLSLMKLEAIRNLTTLKGENLALTCKDLRHLNLTSLHLKGGKFEAPEELADMRNLTSLTLDGMYLKNPTFFNRLGGLTYLALPNNELQGVEFLTSLPRLEYLDLSNNHVWIFREIASLTNLRHLNVAKNELTTWVGIANLMQLEELNVSSNRVHSLSFENRSYFPRMRKLSLAHNLFTNASLKNIKSSTFPNLEELDLGQNKISSVRELADLTSLRRLELKENALQEVGELRGLRRAEYLGFQRNDISRRYRVCPVDPQNVCDFQNQNEVSK